MADIGRRGFVKGATLGALAFTVGWRRKSSCPPGQAAGALACLFRVLDAHQGGKPWRRSAKRWSLRRANPGSHTSSISSFRCRRTNRCCRPASSTSRPPFAEFYRTTITAVDEASRKTVSDGIFAQTAVRGSAGICRSHAAKQDRRLDRSARRIGVCRASRRRPSTSSMARWEGYEALGIPYMPHIPPEKAVVIWPTRKWMSSSLERGASGSVYASVLAKGRQEGRPAGNQVPIGSCPI